MARRNIFSSANTALSLSAGVLCLAATTAGNADTLPEAIATAYQTNPTLQSQRAQLRGTDENYVQARSQYGPTVSVQATARYTQDQLRNSYSGTIPLAGSTVGANSGTGQINITQPIYTGGRATLDTRAAESQIRAGREALRATEGDIVYGVIQAYTDLIRDNRILGVRKANYSAVADEVKEIRARWHAGEVTRTDIAQAEAQLAAEQANVASAENQVRVSQIAYATIIGRNPGSLEPVTHLPNIPQSLSDAYDIAGQSSPEFQQALYSEEQSRNKLASARAADRPTVSLQSSFGYTSELFPFGRKNYDRALVAGVTLSKSIFTSGLSRSLARQAGEQNTVDRIAIETARRQMMQNITNAWNQILTMRANIASQKAQTEAAKLAFKGMRIEYRAGQRSTLDVLIAEEVLRDAEIAEITAEHDEFLSESLLLRYIGRLDAGDIVASLPRYDPADNFRQVSNKGALPWESLIRAVDGIFLEGPNQREIPAPDAAERPTLAKWNGYPDDAARPASRVPVSPVPGTVGSVPFAYPDNGTDCQVPSSQTRPAQCPE